MTEEQLLQQAKEQVATGNGFKNWSELKDYCDELTGSGQLLNYHEEAFELAIQKAREEGYKKGWDDGHKNGWDQGVQEYKQWLETEN